MSIKKFFLLTIAVLSAALVQAQEVTGSDDTETTDNTESSENSEGSEDSGDVTLTSTLVFPNAFSPNHDSTNDVYKAKEYKNIEEFHAYIFNRWGKKLYEWDNPAEGWDGTYNGRDVKQGTYFVLVKARGADGQVFNIRKDVNLLRGFSENTTTSE